MSKATNQIERILKKYNTKKCFAGGSTQEEMNASQQSLGILFPEDYCHFLTHYGAGNFGECEIYGIVPQKDMLCIPNGIWVTKYLRKKYHMPFSYIAIGFDGCIGYYCIDTGEHNQKNLCPVVLWLTEENHKKPERISDSFEQFFLLQLKNEIDKMI